jgi:hypothetical protein
MEKLHSSPMFHSELKELSKRDFIFSYIKNRQRRKTERIKKGYNKPELTIYSGFSDDLYSLLAYGHRVARHTESHKLEGGSNSDPSNLLPPPSKQILLK